MKKVLCIISIFCAFATLVGCGEVRTRAGSTAASTVSNQASVHDLKVLMENHPELSQANLKHIKDSARGNGGDLRQRINAPEGEINNPPHGSLLFLSAPDSDVPLNPDPTTNPEVPLNPDTTTNPLPTTPVTSEPVVLDPQIAQTAQALIDKALDDFDFTLLFNAGVKVAGIQFNHIRAEQERFSQIAKDMGARFKKSGSTGKSDFDDDKFDFNDEKFDSKFDKGASGFDKEIPSCEEIVNNPYIQYSKEKLSEVMNANKENIKKSLSGCPHILGAQFAQCLSDVNEMYKLINQYATCSIKSLNDFEKTMNDATQGDFSKVQENVKHCMSEKFKACGYVEQKVNAENPSDYQDSDDVLYR